MKWTDTVSKFWPFLNGMTISNWNGHGSFKTDSNKIVLFSGKEEGEYSHGVAVILEKEISKSLIEYSPINDRIIKLIIQARPHNISIIQCYAPTSLATENEMNVFYDCLQSTLDTIPSRDVRIIMGNFNAKVGKEQQTALAEYLAWDVKMKERKIWLTSVSPTTLL